MSMFQFSHPRHLVDVEDRSQVSVHVERTLPLFRPFFYIRTESGPPNEPIWYDTLQQAKNVLGEQTFNTSNPEYYVPAIDMIMDIFNSNGCYIARAETDSALPSGALLVAEVKENIDTPVYEIDEITGKFVYVDDEPVQVKDTDGTPVVEKGLHIDYRVVTDWNEILKLVYQITDSELDNDMYKGRKGLETMFNYIESNPLVMHRTTNNTVPATVTIDVSGIDFTEDITVVGLTGFNYTVDELNTIDTLVTALIATTEIESVSKTGTKLTITYATATGVEFSINDITVTDSMIVRVGKTTIPLQLFKTQYPGAYGDDYGFQISPSRTMNSTRMVTNRKGFVYEFAPFRRRFGTINPVSIKSVYGSDEFVAGMSPGMMDPSTNISYDMKQVVQQSYPTTQPLGMDVMVFKANVAMLSMLASYYEESIPTPEVDICVPDTINGGYKWNPEFTNDDRFTATQAYLYTGMLNLFGFTDPEGTVYQYIRTTEAHELPVTHYNVGNRFYLSGGKEGDLKDKEKFSEQFTNFFSLDVNPFIEDQARYPFNFVADCGFVLKNKFDIIDFMAIRDDVVVEVGSVIHPAYHPDPKWTGVLTPREDISIGAVLRERALLTRESIEKGTQSCRANVYAHGGFREGKQGPYGLQFWVMRKLAMYDNRTFLDKQIRGLPNAEVDMFTHMTWVPSTKDLKELAWSTKLNYAQYYDMGRLHIAGRQSVYLTDGNAFSVLDDAGFVKDLVYTKHIVRGVWAKYAGVDDPVTELQMNLENEVTSRLNHMFNGKYQFVAKAYQNELDKAMGVVQRVMIKIVTGAPYWVGPFDIICYRDTQEGALDIDI